MKKGEKVLLTVKPQCKYCTDLVPITYVFFLKNMHMTSNLNIMFIYKFLCVLLFVDGFGEKGKPAHDEEGAVPPNATLQITLELVSWKTVSEVTEDKKIIKKILKEGEGYERPNEGAIVKCKC